MRPVLCVIILVGLCGAGPVAFTQIPEISTDRPDITESAALVPAGLWQLESGLMRERISEESGELRRLAVVEVLARVGVSDLIEARLGAGYVHQRASAGDALSADRGLAGIMTGAKLRLAEGAALLAHLHIPVGHQNLRVPEVAPELVLAGEMPLSERFELSGNAGGIWLSDEAAVFASTALGFDVTDRLGVFIEGYCAGAMDAQPLYQAETGLTYLPASSLQLDCTGGVTLFDSDPGWFLGLGLSVRFPR
ncbi:MAG: hypothetical protein H6Q29_310 [Bacteroidetes bacterium]|nr:hypothetical protein [Bacteroidota bacterium]